MPFKSYFEDLKIGGKAIKINASDRYGQYFRKAENLSIRAGSDRDKVEALFGGDLVKNSPVVVKVRTPPSEDDLFQELLSALKKRGNCFFVASL